LEAMVNVLIGFAIVVIVMFRRPPLNCLLS